MRITRPFGAVIKQLSYLTARKLVLASFAVTLAAGGVVAYQNLAVETDIAMAAPTAESCFATTGTTTKTITNYYTHEGNNPANPACPRDVEIPSVISGGTVTSVGGYGMSSKGLKSVVIPSTLVNLGSYGFAYNEIESLTLPNTITNIPLGAFRANWLTSVVIPPNVTNISDRAFTDNRLTAVTIPSQVTAIGPRAFWGNQLTEVVIPDSVQTISNEAFYNNRLTSVTISNSVTTLGSYVFAYNRLTSVDIPDSVTSIGNYAFQYNQLASLDIPDSVVSIGSYAFANNQLASVTIPDSVTSIGSYAFQSNQLTSVVIPDSIVSIGISVFQANKLTSVVIPSSVTSIGSYAFQNNQITSLDIPNSVTTIGSYAFDWNQLETVTIPGSVTSIGSGAFSSNKLASVAVPSSVISIGDYAFAWNQLDAVTIVGNPATLGVDILDGNPISFISYNGTGYSDNGSTAEECFDFSSSSITGYKGVDLVTIKNSSVACLSRNINIPSTIGGQAVTAIGNNAFYDKQLTSVTLPTSVTSIGNSAFNYNQITSLIIPDSVVSIGGYAFAYNQLNTVAVPSSITAISSGVFYSNQLTSVTLGSSLQTISDYAFASNHLTSVVIPDLVTSIDSAAFEANRLTTVTLGSSVQSIGPSAFRYNKINSIVIPDSVTNIGPTAFNVQSTWGRDIAVSGVSGVPYVFSNDTAEVQRAYDGIWYAQLYTETPSNPNNLTSSALSEGWWRSGIDANGNGSGADHVGGHIINPARATINAVDRSGIPIPGHGPVIQTGIKSSDNAPIRNYLIGSVGTFAPADPYAPTSGEITAMQTGFAQYHHIGDTVAIDAPASIPGYIRLHPASPQTIDLADPDTTMNFTYAKTITKVDFTATPGTDSNPTLGSVPASLLDIISNGIFETEPSKDCSIIRQAKLLEADSFNTPQNNSTVGYSSLGGLDFVLDCVTPGKEATVSFSLGRDLRDEVLPSVRIFKQTADGGVADITALTTITNRNTADGVKTVISYNLVDGGDLDDDGAVDGAITDPVYILVPDALSDELAATGASMPFVVAAAALAVGVGGLGVWRGIRKPQ